MLQLGEHGVVVASTGNAPEVPPADLRVKGETLGCRDGQRVLMEVGVTRNASLISQRRDELVTQIVLEIRRVVMRARSGKVVGEDLNADGAGGWQSIRPKTRNRIWVRGIATDGVRTRGEGIDNSAVVRKCLRAATGRGVGIAEPRKRHQSGVIDDIRRNSELYPVIAQAVSAANHEFVLEARRTPGNTDLRPEVVLLRVPGMARLNYQARQVVRTGTGDGFKHVALFGGERTKIGPAQPQVHSQVPAQFEVILDKQAPDRSAVVLANGRWEPSNRIEAPALAMRRIVQEVPDVEEGIIGHAATGALLQVKEPSQFTAKLDAVASINLGSHILVGVSPLIQSAADIRPKIIHRSVAGLFKTIRGKSDRRLGVGGDFIPAPSGGIHAKLVQERGREGVVPDYRKRLIDLLMVKDVVAPVAVEFSICQGNPVDGESDLILAGNIRIQAAIVLGSRKCGRVDRVVVRKVSHSTERTARGSAAGAGPSATRVVGIGPAEILLAQACRQGCTDIDALARNRFAVHPFRKAGRCAGAVRIEGPDHTITGEGKELRGDASRRRQGSESRRLVPTIALHVGGRLSNSLIVEEREELIFPDRATDAAAELFELIGVFRHAIACAVEGLVGIQARLVGRDKKTAMDVVRAALGGNLKLCAGEAAILGIITIGDNFDAIDGIFRRCDDRCPAPDGAGGADAVNRNAVILGLLPTGNDLRAVFGLKNAVRTTGLPSPGLSTGKVIVVAAAACLRPVRD